MESKTRKKYTDEDMAKAFSAVKSGVPVATASKQFAVSRITLRNKIKGISPVVCKMGPSTILSTEEEERISQWVVEVAKAGFPITKTALLDTVAKLIKEIRDTPFINGRPGRKWFQGFLRRHPTISLKSAEKLTGYRGLLTEAQIRNWFAEVFSYLEVNNYCDILEDGSSIFNADETAFALCPKTAKVLAPRGEKNVYDVSRNSENENIMVPITVQEVPNESYEKVPNRNREELVNHKLFLESLIPVELLRQLQEHDASKDWSGEDSVTELYNVWKKLENMTYRCDIPVVAGVLRKKETKKQQKEREIQSRKRAREEKKAKGDEEKKRRRTARKPNCDERKTNKKQNCDERVEWKCYKCEIFWKNQGFFEKKCKWLKCITCEHRAYNVCISRQHLQKIEMDTSGGEFLCDICNKKNESSDDEPFDEDDNIID
ncbi:hth cenpb-type dna-binding domain [Holotrichia oblita]|uniref:Hth cenpb-type dna-binding domain n=1 Tax=Holotrichia oblita TaxID=644536 RepID=A0ACB9T8T2_HOLOL|nr:hth cenpb-type dna-binding domain [Holotrichia oblita]